LFIGQDALLAIARTSSRMLSSNRTSGDRTTRLGLILCFPMISSPWRLHHVATGLSPGVHMDVLDGDLLLAFCHDDD
jgi:hypothetical protein